MILSSLLLMTSCESDDSIQLMEDQFSLIDYLYNNDYANKGQRPQPPIWADCIEYSGIVTPATFKPTAGFFDELYVMPDHTFYGGLPLISDSKPGDQDYNGGRWHLNVLKDNVDPAKYSGACSEEDLDPNDFEATADYFACPLRPVK